MSDDFLHPLLVTGRFTAPQQTPKNAAHGACIALRAMRLLLALGQLSLGLLQFFAQLLLGLSQLLEDPNEFCSLAAKPQKRGIDRGQKSRNHGKYMEILSMQLEYLLLLLLSILSLLLLLLVTTFIISVIIIAFIDTVVITVFIIITIIIAIITIICMCIYIYSGNMWKYTLRKQHMIFVCLKNWKMTHQWIDPEWLCRQNRPRNPRVYPLVN